MALAAEIEKYAPERIVTSTEPKAMQTGDLVGQKLGIPVTSGIELHEHDRTGAPFLDDDKFEATIADLFARPSELVYGNETAGEALDRFRKAIERLISEGGAAQSLAVVAHGTVISLFTSSVTGVDGLAMWLQLRLPSFVVMTLPAFELVEIRNRIEGPIANE